MPTVMQTAISSEELHNRNCFNYLRSLNIADSVLKQFPPSLRKPLFTLRGQSARDYNAQTAYADLYTHFFIYIEASIESLYPSNLARDTLQKLNVAIAAKHLLEQQTDSNVPGQSQIGQMIKFRDNEIQERTVQKNKNEEWDRFIISIYNNDNNILVDTYEAIKHIPLAHTPIQKGIEHRISDHTKDTGNSVNRTAKSPAYAGSLWGRFSAMLSDNFKPQHDTSLATIRRYAWHRDSAITEQRFGTQGQRHEGAVRVSPLYERYLECEARRTTTSEQITNIYFNNLGRDRTGLEGEKEQALTRELEALESRHPNIAVITLPADQGLMSSSLHENMKLRHEYAVVNHEFLQIAAEDPAATRKIKDFHISPEIRGRVFMGADTKYSKEAEKQKLRELLDDSFRAMGIKADSLLSDAQQQAVWFHFVKFALPNHIISTLNPHHINFSCKDAIDRGGVSSAYYNLVKSFSCADPMSRDEFEQALHAAPAMVKGRGINHHIKLLWNTIDNYINTHYEDIKTDPNKAWLLEWRDANCPHARVDNYLKQRVIQVTHDLQEARSLSDNPVKIVSIEQGLKILAAIKNQAEQGVSGKRLLLEAVTTTPAIALNPSEGNVTAYSKLIDNLSVIPVLNVIGGLMKVLAGMALTLLSLGKLKSAAELTEQGLATASSGWEYKSRLNLQADMRKQLTNLKGTEPNKDDPDSNPDQSHPSIVK